MKPKQNYKPGPMDNCSTPGYALELVVPHLKAMNVKTVWEPATGEGLLANALRDHGFNVVSTSLETGLDFLGYIYMPDIDCIITNPPWSIKHLFVEKCFHLQIPWFLLMPVEAISTHRVLTWLEYDGSTFSTFKKPNVGMTIPTKRINFKMPNKGWKGNGAQMGAAWYSWGSFSGIEIYDASHWTKEYRQKFEV